VVITEVRIKLCEENNERLLAFCSVTFDNAFVVRLQSVTNHSGFGWK
jgi:stage V sporulation protein G